MKNKTIKLLLLFSCFIFISCSEDQVHFSRLPENATILAFGDSLTAGYGAHPSQSYPAILQQLLKVKVINAGISGEISQNGLKRLPELLKKHRPDLLIICHGGNDILRKLNPSELKTNILNMIKLAKAYNAQILLLAVPKPSLLVSPAKVYAEIAKESQVFLANDIMATTLKSRKLKSDAYHPNADGYATIAEQISIILDNQGAI